MDWFGEFFNSFALVYGEDALHRLHTECVKKETAQRNLTKARILRIAEASHHITYAARGEIGMRADLDIPTDDYHGWARKFADPDGTPNYECWRDDEWIREYKRDNPQLVCKEVSGNPVFSISHVKYRPRWCRTESANQGGIAA
jgi:hypothetical protein